MRSLSLAEPLEATVPAHVFRIFHEIGEEGEREGSPVYLVGGVVRDLILDRPNTDYDLVTEGDAIRLAQSLSTALSVRVKTHGRFGTASLIFPDGSHMDLATARTETYSRPGALPKVTASTLEEDLHRRDFTLNAMALRLSSDRFGEIVDPFHGADDLERGLLRILHDRSFEDDPTRIMRAARFGARFGFPMEPHTHALAVQAVREGRMATLTPERFRRELLLGLEEDAPWEVVHRWDDLGVLDYLHPDLHPDEDLLKTMFETLRWYAALRQRETADRPLILLIVLLASLPPAVAVQVAQDRLRLSPPKLERLELSLKNGPQLAGEIPDLDPAGLTKRLKSAKLEEVLFVAALRPDLREPLAAYLQNYRHLRLAVTGDDLIERGYRPGPAFGKALEDALDEKLRGRLRTRKKELEFLIQRLEQADS